MVEIITMHIKQICEIAVLVVFLALMLNIKTDTQIVEETMIRAKDTIIPEQYTMLHSTYSSEDEQEEIRNEIFYGEVELLAILIQAEAGVEDELGKRYVADVVLNRVESDMFPDTIEEVIYQKNPTQFSTTRGNIFITAGYSIKEDVFKIALEEVEGPRQNTEIVYFRTDRYGSGTPAFKHGHHYFSTK